GTKWGRTAQMWGSCGAAVGQNGSDVGQLWGRMAEMWGRCGSDGYTVQVNVNDYLDIYCPRYDGAAAAEQYALYMVDAEGYRTCNSSGGSKRWECRRPAAPRGPVKFSEKFQRYSAFSLGFEFRAGREYYYICGYSERGPINRHCHLVAAGGIATTVGTPLHRPIATSPHRFCPITAS
uniref:Ephrin RBD domain-containing protein n=1 Tax=Phasianus colchicus TaxID=9054 RepID=A0A669QH59_PHACC